MKNTYFAIRSSGVHGKGAFALRTIRKGTRLVEYVGEIGERDKDEFLGNARALLFPIDWPEPFGLAMIEAMACGTPVLATGNGSVPEVVDDGVTGFIVADEAAAAAAARRLHVLDRERIRKVFEERFTAQRMAEDYVALYRCLIADRETVRAVI